MTTDFLSNLEAEQSVLAALMLDGDLAPDITAYLTPAEFDNRTNRLIADVCWELVKAGEPADPVTVANGLPEDQISSRDEIYRYLVDVLESLPVIANWKAYAEIVREKALLRNLFSVCRQGLDQINRSRSDALGIAHQLTTQLGDLLTVQTSSMATAQSVYQHTMAVLQERADNPEALGGLPTGLRALDDRLQGLRPGTLIAIAGRPAMGKSVLAQGIADYCALHQDAVVMHYSMEMPSEELCQRQLSSQLGIDNKKMRSATLTDWEWEQMVSIGDKIKNAKLYINDATDLTAEEVTRQAMQVERNEGRVDLVVVDYLQLMDYPGDDEVAGLGHLSRAFKKLAGKLKCPVIIVCQLNRSCEGRPDKRPLLSDLRSSGAIEQDCDCVLMCYRDEYYHPNPKNTGLAEVLCRKFRQGDVGTDHLKFEGQHYRFVDLPLNFQMPVEPEQDISYQQAVGTRRYPRPERNHG